MLQDPSRLGIRQELRIPDVHIPDTAAAIEQSGRCDDRGQGFG